MDVMTREERQAEAAAAIELCERVGKHMVATGKVEQLTDVELARLFKGDELTAATWLREVVRMRIE